MTLCRLSENDECHTQRVMLSQQPQASYCPTPIDGCSSIIIRFPQLSFLFDFLRPAPSPPSDPFPLSVPVLSLAPPLPFAPFPALHFFLSCSQPALKRLHFGGVRPHPGVSPHFCTAPPQLSYLPLRCDSLLLALIAAAVHPRHRHAHRRRRDLTRSSPPSRAPHQHSPTTCPRPSHLLPPRDCQVNCLTTPVSAGPNSPATVVVVFHLRRMNSKMQPLLSIPLHY